MVNLGRFEQLPCPICPVPAAVQVVQDMRDKGHGYKATYRELKHLGFPFSREEVQVHCTHVMRNVMSSIADAEDSAEMEVDEDYFEARGITLPPEGYQFVAATVEERGANGEKHWVRVKPEHEEEEERVEIRQAQPVVILAPKFPVPTILTKTKWETWMISPDAQIGYWLHSSGSWYTTHDERCFSVGHQVAQAIAETEGLHGWLDLGDFTDQAAPSRHNPTSIDLHAHGLNLTWQRAAEEHAMRRFVVGDEGELVVMGGNHDIRLRTKASQQMPYLVGMKRAGDPEDEYPVLSVPYLTRARDYGVEWCPLFPSGYRKLNSNLYAFHSPAYGAKALETARKISARVKASVVFGHTHRRESLAENSETDKGNRTFELWSDGCWARTDGSLPSARNSFNESGDRLIAGELENEKWGMLSENFHQGFSIAHVEVEDQQRFSVERVAIWDGYCRFRGQDFYAGCTANGDPLDIQEAA